VWIAFRVACREAYLIEDLADLTFNFDSGEFGEVGERAAPPLAPTVFRGFEGGNGFWNTICASPRKR
jgi:hypothetical protein